MEFSDVFTLDAPRRTNDGYLVASVRVARTGIQEYTGREVDPDNKHGMRDKAVVRVWRPEEEVFSRDSMASIAHRSVTIDHPSEPVTAKNWKKYAVGTVGGDVARDGEFVRAQIALMDDDAIKSVESGKRQISQGYSCDLVFGEGTTADGLQFDAKQTNIRANHTAMVGLARGGPELKIGDGKTMKNMLIDGHSVEVSDAAEIAIENIIRRLNETDTARAALVTAATTADAKYATDMAAKDAKIATLDAEVATLKAGQLTGDKLDAAVAERSKLISDAKAIGGETLDVKGTNDDIKKRAVLVKLGDTYKDRDKAFFDAAFELQVVGLGDTDSVRNHLRGQPAQRPMADGLKGEVKAFNDSVNDLNAWRTKSA